jgi:hypothetical protein
MLQKLRPTSAPGPDLIPPRILHTCCISIYKSLAALSRKSLSSGLLPNKWKEANVIPVYKNGSKCDIKNFRPISITSAVCKILERVISFSLLDFVVNNDIIPVHQHGFMPRRSCRSMLLYSIDQWQKLLDTRAGSHIHAISIDWEKAFDRVPHSRLLLKLHNIGIRGPLLNWFHCYLLGRTQRVHFNSVFSKSHNVSSGVIQGSCTRSFAFQYIYE